MFHSIFRFQIYIISAAKWLHFLWRNICKIKIKWPVPLQGGAGGASPLASLENMFFLWFWHKSCQNWFAPAFCPYDLDTHLRTTSAKYSVFLTTSQQSSSNSLTLLSGYAKSWSCRWGHIKYYPCNLNPWIVLESLITEVLNTHTDTAIISHCMSNMWMAQHLLWWGTPGLLI
jgi:hypothetical protein